MMMKQVPTKKAQEWCVSKGSQPLPLFETSAMDDINVESAFDAVARAALRRGEQDDDLYVLTMRRCDYDCDCLLLSMLT